MLILAFDTSGTAGTVAVLEECRVLAAMPLDPARRSAQTLAPAIRELLQQVSIAPAAIRLVATTIGPGSFTGLRIGVTTAKTFAYAVGAEVIGLSTLEVVAAGLPAEWWQAGCEAHAILDAQRRELFVGRFRLAMKGAASAGLAEPDIPLIERLDVDRIVAAETWSQGLRSDVVATGPGLKRFRGQPLPAAVADETDWEPRASVLGRLAWRSFQQGRRDDLWKMAPVYLRASYAEEKAAASSSPA